MIFQSFAQYHQAQNLSGTKNQQVVRQQKSTRVQKAQENDTQQDKVYQKNGKDNKATKRNFLNAVQVATLTTLYAPNFKQINSNLPNVFVQSANAALPQNEPITNAKQLLRNALPINNKIIRRIQGSLEMITEQLRVPGKKPTGPISTSVNSAKRILDSERQNIIKDFAESKKQEGLNAIQQLENGLTYFKTEVLDKEDKQQVPLAQQKCLDFVGQIEEAMVDKFPFEIPQDLQNYPQLKGRAVVQLDIELRSIPNGPKTITMIVELDGYNAPITAGNFVDLVQKKFYDGMQIQRADGFVVQTGKPEGQGKDDGYKDPATGQIRRIPLEIKVQKDKQPIYGETLEELQRFNEQPSLPFNAFGTLALARQEFDPQSGSSQIFFLLKDVEITPAGANLLDGNFAVFGYTIEGQDFLKDMKVGDVINQAKVVKGSQNLVNGA